MPPAPLRSWVVLLTSLAMPAAVSAQAGTARSAAEALVVEGVALLRANRAEEARSHLIKAAETDPSYALAHYFVGFLHEQEQDWAAAQASYSRAIELDDRMAEAHDRLGFVLGQQGRTEDALEQFQTAAALKPDLFDAQYHLGATRWWVRQPDAALAPLQSAVRLKPGHAEAHYYLGRTLRQLGNLPAAIDA